MITVGSLFSGIGGMDLGLERAGMVIRWQVEIDPWCRRVLAKHWPDVPKYGDIRQVDWGRVEPVDVLAGGPPCQPHSFAGSRRGASDPRNLWPEFLKAIRWLRPRYVILEGVPGILSVDNGRLFDGIQRDFAETNFSSNWASFSAFDVGAPHRRARIWLVAYSNRARYVQPEGSISELGRWIGDGRWWRREPDVGRVAYGVPHGVDRRRGLGQAIVPQCAEAIGRMIIAVTDPAGKRSPGARAVRVQSERR